MSGAAQVWYEDDGNGGKIKHMEGGAAKRGAPSPPTPYLAPPRGARPQPLWRGVRPEGLALSLASLPWHAHGVMLSCIRFAVEKRAVLKAAEAAEAMARVEQLRAAGKAASSGS